MKFQKGLLDDLKGPEAPRKTAEVTEPVTRKPAPTRVTDDRLFQTHQRATSSRLQYLKLIGIVSVIVLVGAAVVFYLTLPSKGDEVRAPAGLEGAMRAYFLDVQKRNAEDIKFYYCGSYYSARVEVERRPDIKTNPVYRIGLYRARATNVNDQWGISAVPVEDPANDRPCIE